MGRGKRISIHDSPFITSPSAETPAGIPFPFASLAFKPDIFSVGTQNYGHFCGFASRNHRLCKIAIRTLHSFGFHDAAAQITAIITAQGSNYRLAVFLRNINDVCMFADYYKRHQKMDTINFPRRIRKQLAGIVSSRPDNDLISSRNRKSSVTLRDIIFSCHVNPREREELFRDICNNKTINKDNTRQDVRYYKTKLSRLISQYMSLGFYCKQEKETLLSHIKAIHKRTNQLNLHTYRALYRTLAMVEEIPQLMNEELLLFLDEQMRNVLSAVPMPHKGSVVGIDISSSMCQKNNTGLWYAEEALLYGAACKLNGFEVYVYSEESLPFEINDRVYRTVTGYRDMDIGSESFAIAERTKGRDVLLLTDTDVYDSYYKPLKFIKKYGKPKSLIVCDMLDETSLPFQKTGLGFDLLGWNRNGAIILSYLSRSIHKGET